MPKQKKLAWLYDKNDFKKLQNIEHRSLKRHLNKMYSSIDDLPICPDEILKSFPSTASLWLKINWLPVPNNVPCQDHAASVSRYVQTLLLCFHLELVR